MRSDEHLQELSDKAYRYALLVVKNRDDALDVMQETMYRYIVKKKLTKLLVPIILKVM